MSRTDWDRRYASGELLWASHANRFLEDEVEGLAPGRAIDLACGQGRNAVWLAERGWHVTGVDFSSVGLDQARQLARDRGVSVEWVEADLLAYQLDPLGSDLVLIFYLQVPSEERSAIVTAAAAGLRRGGTFLLVGHDRENLERGHGGPQNPAVLYRAEDVAADLDRGGLTVERAGTVERPVQTPDGERTALDAFVRARRP